MRKSGLTPAQAKKIKQIAIFIGLADSVKTLVKHRDKMVRELKRRGEGTEATVVKSWDSQDLLDFRNEHGI